MSTRELDGWMHALHALSLYDARYFRPRDPVVKPPAEKKSEEKKTAEGTEKRP
jgi:hypothetical protein